MKREILEYSELNKYIVRKGKGGGGLLVEAGLLDSLCKLHRLLCIGRGDNCPAEGVSCQHLSSMFVPNFELDVVGCC